MAAEKDQKLRGVKEKWTANHLLSAKKGHTTNIYITESDEEGRLCQGL